MHAKHHEDSLYGDIWTFKKQQIRRGARGCCHSHSANDHGEI